MAANIGLIFKIWLDELRSLAKGLVCLRQRSKIRQELWIEKAIFCVSQTMLYMLKPICLLLVSQATATYTICYSAQKTNGRGCKRTLYRFLG